MGRTAGGTLFVMKVRIYAQRDTGPEELGAIVLKDGQLVSEPKIPALNNLLSEPLIVYGKTTRILIDPEEQPKMFLEALPMCMRGSYFWAGKVEE
jgi:hypothetical protein